ncbi:hypothetical protein [Legionella spiritensis]|uniref:Legionella vir region protein n=1 Tax=Legionella spiritensis TaxID=452 RepID=A0A0W0Z8V9_LEGSP|nr:hypothetical protein [Legionella spiritensis]KTD65363.1 Legionella vir region protein [Legionella spiritensis]SNV47267.1 Legionella vir region protein [Legionella spiritensis]
MKKTAVILYLFAWTALLTACHHNPLKEASPRQRINFLMAASTAAEKRLDVFVAPGGGYYLSCMQGEDLPIDCRTLFANMVAYAQTTKTFKDVTVAELTDPALFAEVVDDYQNAFFNAV